MFAGSFSPRELPSDVQLPSLKVDVGPAQAEELTRSEAGQNDRHQQGTLASWLGDSQDDPQLFNESGRFSRSYDQPALAECLTGSSTSPKTQTEAVLLSRPSLGGVLIACYL
jgi:hypothetical protein